MPIHWWRLTVRRSMIAVAVVATLLAGWITASRKQRPISSIISVWPQTSLLDHEDGNAQELSRLVKRQHDVIRSRMVLSSAAGTLRSRYPALAGRVPDLEAW